MGSGKTEVGKRVAEELDIPFVDMDELIQEQSRKTIPQIFEKWGEERFRRMEFEVLTYWIKEAVYATGGGAVTYKKSLEFLKNTDHKVIWLNPSWEVIWDRIKDSERYYVQEMKEEELRQMWEERLPLYKECATLTIEETNLDKIVKKIVKTVG
jgi:shikimate kinase